MESVKQKTETFASTSVSDVHSAAAPVFDAENVPCKLALVRIYGGRYER